MRRRRRYGARKPIEVQVYAEGGEARVDVRDHGIGISAENQKRIFQQFERVAASHAVAGLGLGLFISEQIITAHSGRISVESEEGAGSLFRVSLPL
jgi:signal transduction histidine kinase